jgi:hypothetical protein
MDTLGYDQRAAEIESALRKNYPRLTWRVYRAEDTCDSPEEFYKRHAWRFEIWCSIPELEWKARQFLSRELWAHDGERLVPMIGATFARYMTGYFLGGLLGGKEYGCTDS